MLELGAIAMKKEQGQGEFAVAMTTQERLQFLKNIINRGEYNKMLGTVNAETSDCSRPEDREDIHDSIREKIGFGKLNRMVLGVLEVWIEEHLQSQVVCCEKAGQSAEAIKWKAVIADVLSDQGRYNGALEIKKQVLELCYATLPANDPAIGKKNIFHPKTSCLLVLTLNFCLTCRLGHERCCAVIFCSRKTPRCT